jgi:hypothetical protein
VICTVNPAIRIVIAMPIEVLILLLRISLWPYNNVR